LSLEERFAELVNEIKSHPLVVDVSVVSGLRIGDEGYIRLVARFINGGELRLFEYRLRGEVEKYAYHLQDAGGRMILRYDNRPHYPDVETFPHHKHVADKSEPQPSRRPAIRDLLVEASKYV
jgi:hypothetical protein